MRNKGTVCLSRYAVKTIVNATTYCVVKNNFLFIKIYRPLFPFLGYYLKFELSSMFKRVFLQTLKLM